MLRRLNPEISLGFVIASLFWIAVLGWQSSYSLPENEKQRCYEEAKKPGHKDEECKTFWERTTSDPIAFFTFTLSIVTLALGAISFRQFYYLRRSDETARIAANAADLNARAVIALQLPLIQIQPASLGHGTHSDSQGQTENCSVHFIDIANQGNSRAFPKEVLYGWTVGNSLPVEPFYQFLDKFSLGRIIEPNGPTSNRQFLTMDYSLNPGEWAEICKGNYLWFYVDIIYDDFMGATRHQSSCWRWAYIGSGVGWRPDETAAYNRKT